MWFATLADKLHLSLSFSLATILLTEMQSIALQSSLLVGVLGLLCTLETAYVPPLERAVVLTFVQWYTQRISELWRTAQEPMGSLLVTAPLLALILACSCTWAAQQFGRRSGVLSVALVDQLVSLTMLFVTTDVLENMVRVLPEALIAVVGAAHLLGHLANAPDQTWLQHLQLYLHATACRAAVTIGVFRLLLRITASGLQGLLVLTTAGAWFWGVTSSALATNDTYKQCKSMFSYNMGRLAIVESHLLVQATIPETLVWLCAVAALHLAPEQALTWWVADAVLVAAALQVSAHTDALLVGIAPIEQCCLYVALLYVVHWASRSLLVRHDHDIAHEGAPNNVHEHEVHLHSMEQHAI
jgi:hypothetical protein